MAAATLMAAVHKSPAPIAAAISWNYQPNSIDANLCKFMQIYANLCKFMQIYANETLKILENPRKSQIFWIMAIEFDET